MDSKDTCEKITSEGKQCTRLVSTKKEDNNKLCWQHQPDYIDNRCESEEIERLKSIGYRAIAKLKQRREMNRINNRMES